MPERPLADPTFMLTAMLTATGLVGANERKIERYTAVVLGGDDVKGRQTAAVVERSTTVTLMYAAHCSLSTRRSYGICDEMKQYSTGQRTFDIRAAVPYHQPTRYGRETERSYAIPIRSLSSYHSTPVMG